MTQPVVPDKDLRMVLDAYAATHHSKTDAARMLGLPYMTYCHRFKSAIARGFKVPTKPIENTELVRIRQLTAALKESEEHNKKLAKEVLSAEAVKRLIHGCDVKFKPPAWLTKKNHAATRGVPTFFASDWHWDEVVEPAEVNYVNGFNRRIAQERARKFLDTGVELLTQHMARPKYDYCVLALGGDMLSGNIHEELAETNEYPIHSSLLSVADVLIAAITKLHDTFGRVYVPVVVGNHGRITRKPRHKHRAHDNYDWLLGQIVARHFQREPGVQFDITDGAEIQYQIYGLRYLLHHGDQFRGGTGISGPYMPWMLGDARKRKRQVALRQPYDVLLQGHWHHYSPLRSLITNGSLKGHDEYSRDNNFDFEVPTQAIWITHPEHGITVHWPVYLEPQGKVFRA